MICRKISKFPNAKLISVVKNQLVNDIQDLIDAGAKIIAFGRVQEAEEKMQKLYFSGKKHFIGRLQSNKVKKAVVLFDMIESVTSFPLAEKISLEAGKKGKVMDILLQVNISNDSNKAGFSLEELTKRASELHLLPFVRVCGLMTIGKRNVLESETRKEFQQLRKLCDRMRSIFGDNFTECSMGMSNDFVIALEEGATMVRIGKGLFSRE